MARFELLIPDELKEDIDKLVNEGQYVTANEFIRDAIRKLVKDIKYKGVAYG